MMAIKTKPIKA